ncbi:hypothetical protein DBV15_00645 [Temnothorax longispinosus]|uniref:Uncharacterized protein n=1 Tax=Temnothorax longispinosus TaxID=300112 RepID=A0A4S2KNP2_9HYME|nr:hypothetical protein DBV15_00645 [Temnothorax longispinosus]
MRAGEMGMIMKSGHGPWDRVIYATRHDNNAATVLDNHYFRQYALKAAAILMLPEVGGGEQAADYQERKEHSSTFEFECFVLQMREKKRGRNKGACSAKDVTMREHEEHKTAWQNHPNGALEKDHVLSLSEIRKPNNGLIPRRVARTRRTGERAGSAPRMTNPGPRPSQSGKVSSSALLGAYAALLELFIPEYGRGTHPSRSTPGTRLQPRTTI